MKSVYDEFGLEMEENVELIIYDGDGNVSGLLVLTKDGIDVHMEEGVNEELL